MSKSIEISVDVFAAIWKAQKQGERNEDDILRRVFRVTTDAVPSKSSSVHSDTMLGPDFRFGDESQLPLGVRIFRNHKAQKPGASKEYYSAVRTSTGWLSEKNHKNYSTINSMSVDLGIPVNNIYRNWRTVLSSGKEVLLESLRPAESTRRRLEGLSLKDLDL